MKNKSTCSILILSLLSISHLDLSTKGRIDGAIASTIIHFTTSDIARRFICGPDCSILAIMELCVRDIHIRFRIADDPSCFRNRSTDITVRDFYLGTSKYVNCGRCLFSRRVRAFILAFRQTL